MIRRFITWLFDYKPRVALKEDAYPVDAKGRPDLTFYQDPPEYYFALIQQYIATIEGKQGSGYEPELAFKRCVHGQWGLIARGDAAIPYAMQLLEHPVAEAKESGAAVLGALREQPGVVNALLKSLDDAGSDEARDTIIGALGVLRAKPAIPVLARLLRDEHTNPDTRWNVAESLGEIARRPFTKASEPVAEALAWLTSKGF
jgi:hypothetical protein